MLARKPAYFVCSLLLLLLTLTASVYAQQLAFPTAEGFGRFSVGGRGGFVCHVDDLGVGNDGNPVGVGLHHQGTFPYCHGLSGNRTIVFRTGGIIDWASQNQGSVPPNITIAGQTAPPDSDGILIRRARLWLPTNTIVRHYRGRPGSTSIDASVSRALEFVGDNIIVDHTSVGWGKDDQISGIGSVSNITVQWSIISEGINATASQGAIWTSSGNVSFLHNYLSNMTYRMPRVSAGNIQMVNNVLYNCGIDGTSPNYSVGPTFIEYVKNYMRQGPNSNVSNGCIFQTYGCGWSQNQDCGDTAASSIYFSGNFHNTLRPNNTFAEDSFVSSGGDPITVIGTPYGTYPIIPTEVDAVQARTDVISQAGASMPKRDSFDIRVLDDIDLGTGRIISSESAVGGYPTYAAGIPLADADWDGIPNTWETMCSSSLGGLNPNDPDDGANIISGIDPAVNGYSKLEIYLNELAGDYPLDTCGGLLVASNGFPSPPTNLSSNVTNPITFPGTPSNLSDTANNPITFPGTPSNLSDTANNPITFPNPPTGLQ